MIKALYQNENADFFIHIDAKCNQKEFETCIKPPYRNRVTFTPHRYEIQWGGFNQVRYQQELLRVCLGSGSKFYRIFILTGQDYPLLSNEEINKELAAHPQKEYIIGLDISNIASPSKIRKKLVLYHFFRDMEGVSYQTKKIFSGASRLLMTLLPVRKKPYIVIQGKRWDVFQSSSYMCVTYELASCVYKEMLRNRKLMSYFKYSFVPEEMVIPTIVFNSPFRTRCEYYTKGTYDGLKYLSGITYFNYGKEIQTFTLNDYEELKRSGKMFARKFATGVSDSLMDKLDKEHGL